MKDNLPTESEYNEYMALSVFGASGGCVGLELYNRYLELKLKCDNIKFPATKEDIKKQLKSEY